MRQNNADSLTIAIEAGIQNIGIAFFLLRFSLPQPYRDISSLIPVSIALMTPLPPILLLVAQKIVKLIRKKEVDTINPIKNVNENEFMLKA